MDRGNAMKKILVPSFMAAVCLLGYVVFEETENKKQQQLHQLLNSVEPKAQELSPVPKPKLGVAPVDAPVQSDAEGIL